MTATLSMPKRELSCFIGNLFAELDPPCDMVDGQSVAICGRTVTGNYARLRIAGDIVYFDGDAGDLDCARNGRCPNGVECGRKGMVDSG